MSGAQWVSGTNEEAEWNDNQAEWGDCVNEKGEDKHNDQKYKTVCQWTIRSHSTIICDSTGHKPIHSTVWLCHQPTTLHPLYAVERLHPRSDRPVTSNLPHGPCHGLWAAAWPSLQASSLTSAVTQHHARPSPTVTWKAADSWLPAARRKMGQRGQLSCPQQQNLHVH